MSFSAAHESKAHRQICQACRERKAKFRHRGPVRADRDHTLCFERYRSERDRRRACLLAENARERLMSSPFAHTATLSVRSIAHRRAMLAHLQRHPPVAVNV